MKALRAFVILFAIGGAALAAPTSAPAQSGSTVLKATLGNGLQVVIVRNTIAPVVSTDLTYLVGSRDDPPSLPGMAHAQEHMMFRGTPDLTTAQLGTIATALGGDFNAQTAETRTAIPVHRPGGRSRRGAAHRVRPHARRARSAVAMAERTRRDRARSRARRRRRPGSDFFDDVAALAFKGTPYEHAGVGTKAAFDRLTGPQLKAFWRRWYAPNNAVLVIAGDVDPQATLADVRAVFDSIPRRAFRRTSTRTCSRWPAR